jgi:hypothetical protein
MGRKPPDSRSLRILKTKAEVMRELGGIGGLSALTGSKPKNTENWSRADKFPARYFLVMTFALYRKGARAAPEMWGQVTPAERKQALAAIIADVEKERSAA